MSKHNTNLAAEFYVLSMLHRLGIDAHLTLSNRKAVDIVVVRSAGETITIDVKGLAYATGFPIDNVRTVDPRHFLVFVSYMGKINQPSVAPRCWILPSHKLKNVTFTAPGGRRLASIALLKTVGTNFENSWHLIS